jgi:fumarylacetoacetate (FAA) hydrolase
MADALRALGVAFVEYDVDADPDLAVDLNGAWFGHPSGAEMNFGFHQLIAHAAATRRLSAGTILGSGTVSNAGNQKGSACIAERRAIETIQKRATPTPFMKFGDRIRMEARWRDQPVFGEINQRMVQAIAPSLAG